MRDCCRFVRRFKKIRMTTVPALICTSVPILFFILFHFVIVVLEDEAGSIVSNDKICTKIGEAILREEGSVTDAAIGTMLCEGVILPNRAGIGGGFTAIMYINGNMDTITATPVVPSQFPSGYISIDKGEISGALAAGVPGELRGYWEMHKKYGLLPWRRLFEPTIELCEKGIPITEWLEVDMQRTSSYLYRSKTLWKLYHALYEQSDGKKFKFLALAKTLRRIANEGVDVFYGGDIGRTLIEDIRNDGGLMLEKDLIDYNVSWNSRPIIFNLPRKLRGFTTPLPSLGAVVAMAMNMIKGIRKYNSPIFWHKSIEALKHAYGHSSSLADIEHETDDNKTKIIRETYLKMIDMDYAFQLRNSLKDDRLFEDRQYYGAKFTPTFLGGSSNICVISQTGDAIVMTSSLMWDFGSFSWSSSTGIYLNNQIRSFTPASRGILPPSPSSFVRPGKRAISPHCPTIVLHRHRAAIDFVIGASGSALIPTLVITGLINKCLLRSTASTAVNSGFYHPDLMAGEVFVVDSIFPETQRDKNVVKYLKEVGHPLKNIITKNPYAIRTCIDHSHLQPDGQFTQHQEGGSAIIEAEHQLSNFFIFVFACGSVIILSMMIYEIGIAS